ncbi:hypothetical protein FB566_1778 [Stackebrandtia endophytica]|uniref:Glyoxalase-like domain-containing protein n=1 Tax=Stackebrandtia endophytica TaxID=1496996 RepID=A0A543AUK7_9ACTN|nr:VOC family protein [Stackebrandtia endophytica]TQL76254.1 hypothetical protein FB566_1778 [Stackebrandtia endophytica]
MNLLESITLQSADPTASIEFYRSAFGIDDRIRAAASQAATTGFRGFALSLVVSQPGDVDSLVSTALAAGATAVKPVAKSFWGYGGVVRDPDGAMWKIASSSKKNTGPTTREIKEIVLLLGVADVAVTKTFYVDHGLTVARSFGRKYVEFATGPIKLALYGRRAAAKDVGVSPDGAGSHRIVIDGAIGASTDPDGFEWQPRQRDGVQVAS